MITDVYCDDPDNATKTICNLVRKHMNKIIAGFSIAKEQALYILGGGALKRSSCGKPLKCSVIGMAVEDLGAEEHE